MPLNPIARIHRSVRRVRWRIKLQRTLRRLITVGAGGVVVAALTLLLFKLRFIGIDQLWIGIGIAGAAILAAIVTGLAARIDDVDAAARLDDAGGFHDRLSNAIAFSALPSPSPMMKLAIDDAQAVVDAAQPKLAAPWSRPPRLGVLGLALVFFSVSAWADFPLSEMVGQGVAPLPTMMAPQVKPQTQLRAEDKKRLKDELERLKRAHKRTSDPRLKKWIAKLNQLIRDLAAGKITPKEAFAQMAELEKAKTKWRKEVTRGYDKVAKKLKKAAKAVKKPHKALKNFKKALEEARWKAAAKAMEKIRKQMASGKMKSRDRKKIGRDLKKMANALKSARQKALARLKKERNRLKKKQKRLKNRLSKRDKNRLKRNKRELERLRREQKQMSQSQRTLQRLQRNMDRAAAELMRRLKKGQKLTQKQMKQAEEMLRRLKKQQQGRKTMRVAEGKLIDIKEMLRRGGRLGKSGRGGKGSKLDKFFRKAGGKKGSGQGQKGDKVALLKKGGKGQKIGILGGPKAGSQPGRGPGKKGNRPGDGVGKGHNPNALGKKTSLSGKHREDHVSGRKGKGPTKSRVVFAAAKKGFASRRYRRVHQDYRGVVEKTMRRQKIPAGKRRYVRRYFDLIRPR